MRRFHCAILLLAFAAACVPSAQLAAAEPAGLFEAISAGDLDAKLVMQDETVGRIVLTNKTKQPLAIKLPEGFAGVPVLAQLGNFGNGGNRNGNRTGNNGGNQGVGLGQAGGQQPGGIFSIEPEKAVKVKVVGVCLEHGKREPNPYVTYRLLPLDEYTTDSKVIEVVRSLARGDLDQKSAQAAAWHLANGLSWQQLAKKIGVRHLNGQIELFFTSAQLERAFQVVEAVSHKADSVSPGTSGD